MSVVARSLDDLDRLAFRLSRTVRTQFPQLLTQGFTLTDLEERLLPYREVRREMADGGADAFETALLRLISGERGYLHTDAELQNACRQALGFPSPTLAMVRSWATTTVRLAQPGTPADGVAATQNTASASGARPQVVDPSDLFPAPSANPPSGGVGAPPVTPSTRTHVCCRYCDNRLPEGRKVTYCPHCGMDMTKRQCPACSTELEVHWKYCVTCGRSD